MPIGTDSINRDMTAIGWSWEAANAPRCNACASSGRHTCEIGMFGHKPSDEVATFAQR